MDNINEKLLPNLQLSADRIDAYSKVPGLSLQSLFFARNGEFPGCYLFNFNSRMSNYTKFETEKLKNHLFEIIPEDEKMEFIPYITRSFNKDGTSEEKLGFCVILNKSNIYARIEESVLDSYVLFSNNKIDELYKFIDELLKFFKAPESEEASFYMLQRTQTGFNLSKSKIKEYVNFDIKKQYNDDIIKEDTKIRSFIGKENESGLIILHGEKGTGKTTYIRNLISSFPNRKFVYIPSNLITLMGDPSFTSFLMTLNNHVIILEDCEDAIRDRKVSHTGPAVSQILNMTDGLIGDDLGMKFICTFNEDVQNIDSALTRKGRLVSKYFFKALSVEKANNLLRDVYMSKYPISDDEMDNDSYASCDWFSAPTTNKPMTLADIYYFDEDGYDNSKKNII